MNNFKAEERYLAAKSRVEKIKGYYWHLASYVIVNTFISSFKIASEMQEGATFMEAFFDLGTFALWFFLGNWNVLSYSRCVWKPSVFE